jgi:glyoxylase-like metal-dependent hydrolase (beta-lactamase superfamily II)
MRPGLRSCRGREEALATTHPVVIDMHIPAGMLGPDPVDMDVRCFVVPHGSGVVLVDTGVEPDRGRIAAGLAAAGAAWADVSDVVLTHNHPDHVGGLAEVRRRARQATVWGGADECDGGGGPLAGLRSLLDQAR